MGRGGVSSGIEDSEVRASNLEPIVRSYRQFSAPMERGPSKQSKEDEEKQNYYVNIGYAIQTLREEFPDIFYRELRFDIYRFNSISYSIIVCFGLIIRLVSERMIEKLRNFLFLTCHVLIYVPDYF